MIPSPHPQLNPPLPSLRPPPKAPLPQNRIVTVIFMCALECVIMHPGKTLQTLGLQPILLSPQEPPWNYAPGAALKVSTSLTGIQFPQSFLENENLGQNGIVHVFANFLFL